MSSVEVQMPPGFEAHSVLGKGAMGKVYKAFQPKLKRYVAIKTCNIREAEESGQDPARLEDEALTIARLNHPNIISLYDVYRDSEAVYLIMELLEGQPYSRFLNPKVGTDKFGELADMIVAEEPRRLVNDAVVEVGLSVARALEYAHQRNVLHRDVKPANIFITNDRHVKLLDFSIARNVNQTGGRTATGVIFGTVAYMSPEQILSNPLDGRTDIYSLGCTLYHLATGQTPYPDPNEITVCMKHVQDPVPDPMVLNLGLSPLVGEIIRKCLQKEPTDRYSSAKELADEFKVAVGSSQVVMPTSKTGSGSMVPILSGSTTPPPSDLASPEAKPAGPNLPPDNADSSGVAVLEVDERGLPVLKKTKSNEQVPVEAKVPTPPPPTRTPEPPPAQKPVVVSLANARAPEPPPSTPSTVSKEKKILSLEEKAAKAGGVRGSSTSSANGELKPLGGDWVRPKTSDWAVSGHSHDMSLTEAVFGGANSDKRRLWFEEHKKPIIIAAASGVFLLLMLVVGIGVLMGDDDEPPISDPVRTANPVHHEDPITVAVANPTPEPTPLPTPPPTPAPSPTPAATPTELPAPQAAALAQNVSKYAVGLPGGRELVLVEVSAGSYFMGSPEEEPGRGKDEGPLTKVEFEVPFFMAEKEITVGQWKSVMGENSIRGEDSMPVSNVSWEQATEFCRRMTAATDLPCFLPTEAQWEYACRAGTQTAFAIGPIINNELANVDGTVPYPRAPKSARLNHLAEPGSYPPNAWGLFDMHGNVWELTWDSYGKQLPGGTVSGWVNSDVGTQRVIRGGSWKEGMASARSASREPITSSMKKEDVGFRVVIEL